MEKKASWNAQLIMCPIRNDSKKPPHKWVAIRQGATRRRKGVAGGRGDWRRLGAISSAMRPVMVPGPPGPAWEGGGGGGRVSSLDHAVIVAYNVAYKSVWTDWQCLTIMIQNDIIYRISERQGSSKKNLKHLGSKKVWKMEIWKSCRPKKIGIRLG